MDYKKFVEELPTLYKNWGQISVSPINSQFGEVKNQVTAMTTPNVMQLLNWAVKCMENDEIYCEVGSYQGSTLIAALLNNSDVSAYAVNHFVEFDVNGENLKKLSENLATFSLEEQVIFCNQDFEEFFFDLKQYESETKIGVYFYDGAHDYRSQLLGLLLAKPFLADQALIIVDDTNWQTVKQANWDFLASERRCQLLFDFQTPYDGHHTFWNGIQVFSWDVNEDFDYDWSEFVEQFRNQQVIKSIYDLHFQFDFKKQKVINNPQQIKKTHKEAACFALAGLLKEAVDKYQEILQSSDNHAPSWNGLGMAWLKMEELDKAEQSVKKAIKLDSSISDYHYNLGLIQEKQGKTQDAMESYQKAIEINPKFIDAYNNLGNMFQVSGDLESAYLIYNRAIFINPEHFGSYLNLGNVFMAQEKFDQAIENYTKALKLQPENPDGFHNLGLAFEGKKEQESAILNFAYAYYYQRNFNKAIVKFEEYLTDKIGDQNCYLCLGKSYRHLNQGKKALAIYKEAIKHYPRALSLYIALLSTYVAFGDPDQAISETQELCRLFPDSIGFKWLDCRILPMIYSHQEEINVYRQRYTEKLKQLTSEIRLDSEEQKKESLLEIQANTNYNFFLQYQGQNDLELQKIYGGYVHQVMSANYPQWVKPIPQDALIKKGIIKRKIRIGYISKYFNNHTVGSLFAGWLRHHNQGKFQIYTYFIDNVETPETQFFKIFSHGFQKISSNIEKICEQILADHLDVLVFLDIGMEQIVTCLCSLRLAPIQCMAWGHPITSGSPTIDYFLSSKLMEPENAQEHYSEKLILLPNLSISYAIPPLPEKQENRSFFQLKANTVVYLSCQSLFKYLPQYDYIFGAIAKQVPHAQFAFISSQISDQMTNIFKNRLKLAFEQFELNSEDYCVFTPRLKRGEYASLNLVSDIYLDTLSWSGGKTTLLAIGYNLPVVTCPGEFMRGRHSYGILKMLGLEETIASSEAEYIDIAVRLGNDPLWRKTIIEKIKANRSNLYDDKECIRGLEDFYESVVLSK